MRSPDPIDVGVLLPSDWSALAVMPTRWQHVIDRWRADPRVRSLTVVSLPRYRRRYALERRVAWADDSWMEGVSAITARLGVGPKAWPLDSLGWRRTRQAIESLLPGARGGRLVVSTHPLWNGVAVGLKARRHGFDAFDDWTSRPASAGIRDRLTEGYAMLRDFDVVTANSNTWANELQRRWRVDSVVVGNGVDLDRFASPGPPPPGLPPPPFAVYLGTIEDRVDIDVLEATTRVLPVVVAGPATGSIAQRLISGGLHWLGPVPPELVPGLLAAATVGLVPHHVNTFTASMDPMKVLEYLACGLSVVSTPVRLPEGVSEFVRVASTTADFVDAVGQAMRAPRRVPGDLLEGRSWDTVAERLLDLYVGGPSVSTGR